MPFEQRRNFQIRDDYPEHLRDKAESVYWEKGFFLSLPPIPGGLEAVRQMVELGHDVRICTSPIKQYENCVLEKFQWVEKHLGREFTQRIVLTRDKTLVRGHVLIDDRPEFKGALAPEWEHIVFDRPYNRHVTDKRRMDWTNWKEVMRL